MSIVNLVKNVTCSWKSGSACSGRSISVKLMQISTKHPSESCAFVYLGLNSRYQCPQIFTPHSSKNNHPKANAHCILRLFIVRMEW